MAGRTRRILGDRNRRRQGALDRLMVEIAAIAREVAAGKPGEFRQPDRINREIETLKKRLGLLIVPVETETEDTR